MADRRHYLSAPTTGTPASIQQTTREGVDMSKLGVDGKRKPGVKFEKIKEQLMKDEEFRVEYDKLKPRYEVISQIIEERNAQRLTQEELAFRVGTQKSNISRFESGSYNPSLDFLVKVAKSLGKEVHIEIR
jgi:DNA-binding XRE family transcriptional regulator